MQWKGVHRDLRESDHDDRRRYDNITEVTTTNQLTN